MLDTFFLKASLTQKFIITKICLEFLEGWNFVYWGFSQVLRVKLFALVGVAAAGGDAAHLINSLTALALFA